METRLRISFLLTYRLKVKLFTKFVESGLGQHAIGFLKSWLDTLSRLVLSGSSACFHLERSVIQTNKWSRRFEPGNKITRGNGHLLLIPIQSELVSFASAILYITDLRYIVSPNMQDIASLGLWPFPDAIFYLFGGELVEDNWEKTGGVFVRYGCWLDSV